MSLVRSLNLQETYQTIVPIGCELANTPHGFIYVVNKKKEELELTYGTGFYRRYQGVKRRKNETSFSSTVWKTGRTLSIQDIQQWQGRARDCSDGWEKVRSVLGIPLHSDFGVIAVLGLGFLNTREALIKEKSDLLKRFVRLAAVALHNTDELLKVRTCQSKQSLRLPDLTDRERTVLNRMAVGLSNHEIAQDLRIEISTVKTHMHHLFAKLEVRSRAQALIKAWELGLIVNRP
jgi:DNA-binding CsgD family transcriptional regulator